MTEKNWKKKVWKVVKKIACDSATIVAFALVWVLHSALSHNPGRPGNSGREYYPGGGNGSIWVRGSGQTKKPGSWSEGRHG